MTKLTMPMVPLRGLVMFPHILLGFDAEREFSKKAIQVAMEDDGNIFLVTQKNIRVDNPDIDEIYEIGVICSVRQIVDVNGCLRVTADGIKRARLLDMHKDGYISAQVLPCEQLLDDQDEQTQAHMRVLTEEFEKYATVTGLVAKESVIAVSEITSASKLVDLIACNVLHTVTKKQEVLELLDVKQRLLDVINKIEYEISVSELQHEIEKDVRKSIESMQHDHLLREQIKAINARLGEDDSGELKKIKASIMSLKIDEQSRQKILADYSKLEKLPSTSPDYHVLLSYLETLLSLPFGIQTPENVNIARAKRILDKDHFGLEKVKQRILEYLAVSKLTGQTHGSILCFVGPPGVGKTSIAKSIARAQKKKYVRMSLGGVHDEAQIRGHRRTYIGAMPGRIVMSIKKAGSMNPVFLLDEIDKMASDFKGDPSSAMLEVLDKEINNTFSDNYLDIDFDLSKVMFITTANDASKIPAPLLDRMEVIELSGYTEHEKVRIAQKYLAPRQIKECGLSKDSITIKKAAIKRIINEYTCESGVRNLEQLIEKICSRAAMEYLEGNTQICVDAKDVPHYLGVQKYMDTVIPREPCVGVSIGLAYTAAGGTVLPIEVAFVDGTGKLELTGHLGDVMKESAKTALTVVRQTAQDLGINPDFYSQKDIHIHVPEGAVPKDGPSAGITLATAIASAALNIPVRNDVAMTGEITLTGRVLPIGGLKEKALAALRAGIKRVIIPAANQKDIDEIGSEHKIEFIAVSHVSEVFRETICK